MPPWWLAERSATRSERVTTGDGIVLHYAYDGSQQSSPYPLHGMVALVHRDELYDVQRRQDWLYAAPVFGIPFGARLISVFIELPDNHPVVPDGYRQFLRHAGGHQSEVACRHFAALVHANRPDWLRAIIDARAPSSRAPDPSDETAPTGETDPFDDEPAPEILILRAHDEIEARGLQGRAGRYYPETHQLFLNATYPAVTRMRSDLETLFAWTPDPEQVARLAVSWSERSMAARVGRMLIFALARQGDWPDHEIAQACSPHALSLAADGDAASRAEAEAAIEQALNPAALPLDPAQGSP